MTYLSVNMISIMISITKVYPMYWCTLPDCMSFNCRPASDTERADLTYLIPKSGKHHGSWVKLWGEKKRHDASVKMFMYSHVGSVFFIVSAASLYHETGYTL